MNTLRELTDKLTLRDAQLMESEKKYAAIFDINPIPMILTTVIEGTIIDVNSAFVKYSGYEKNEVIGKNMSELKIYKDYGDRTAIITEVLSTGEIQNKEIEIVNKDGKSFITFISAKQIQIKGEVCLLVTLIDIFNSTKLREEMLNKL